MVNKSKVIQNLVCSILVLTLSLVFLSSDPLAAGEETAPKELQGVDRSEYLENFVRVPGQAVREVVNPDQEHLRRNLLVGGALLGSFFLDGTVRDFSQDVIYAGDTLLTEILYEFGNPDLVVPALFGAGGLSYLAGSRYHLDSVLLTFQSLAVTQSFTELFKQTVLRERPRNSPDDPFSREEGGHAFFSGHAAGAWAALTIIAGRYPDLSRPAYGLAAAISAARIYEDAHWLSDVVAGSIAGYGVARLTLSLNGGCRENLSVQPLLGRETVGVATGFRF